MDRSPHSDFVYAEAMFQQGFINKNSKLNLSYRTYMFVLCIHYNVCFPNSTSIVQNIYNEVRTDSLFALWKPHLVIQVSQCRNKKKKQKKKN